jgi:2-methylcitrate dehydratase PrpD
LFAATLRFEDIPSVVIAHAKLALLDVLGCGLYGSTLPWTRLVHDYVGSQQARADSGVWGIQRRSSPELAALANGTAAHGAELDDLHRPSFYHPSAGTVPAALAVSDDVPDVSGPMLLTSLVAGYEVGTRVGMALGHGHFTAGYHPQGTCAVFSAAAASGRLLGLDARQMVHALGIAGTQAAGLMAAQEGAMVKRMHSGLACRNGVQAAALAARGFTGIVNVFEAPFGGLLSTLGTGESDAELLTARLGQVWQTERLEFKWHAAGVAVHTALDVVQDLCSGNKLSASDIETIRVYCTTFASLHCGFRYRPAGATAAQLSFQYCIAAMVLFGTVSIEQFDEALLNDGRLLSLCSRVEVFPLARLDELGSQNRDAVEIEIRTTAGAALHGARSQRKGNAGEPIDPARVIEKFRQLASHALTPQNVDDLQATVLNLDDCAEAHVLTRLMQPR